MDNNTDWPAIEFQPPQIGILAKFTPCASEAVASILVKEMVQRIDRPSPSDVNGFSTDQELEWVMQAINHALTLPYTPDESYGTLRSAVRIYLVYLSALTSTPHDCCPKQLLIHPDRYFRKILEAFRHIFEDKYSSSSSSSTTHLSNGAPLQRHLSRQGTQIRTILTALRRHLCDDLVVEEFRDEVWARSLLFLMNASEQLLSVSNCRTQESIGFLMAGELCSSLFTCWTEAALNELVPSPSYWRTLSVLGWQCAPHVQFVECWARTLLNTTAVLLHCLFGHPSCYCCDAAPIFDETSRLLFEPYMAMNSSSVNSQQMGALKGLWHNLMVLLGNPAEFLKNGILLCERAIVGQNNLKFFLEQLALSFFLVILAFKKLIDLFMGDPISIDSSSSIEGEEALNVGRQKQRQESGGTTVAAKETDSAGTQVGRNSSNMSLLSLSSSTADSATLHGPANVAQTLHGNQQVWSILRSNPFKRNSFHSGATALQMRPSALAMLDIFLDYLYASALWGSQHIQQLVLKQKEEGGGGAGSNGNNGLVEEDEDAESRKSAESAASLHDSGSSIVAGTAADGEKPTIATPFAPQRIHISRRSIATSNSGSSNGGHRPSELLQVLLAANSSSAHPPPSSVDGMSAGRATAIGALCRIVCSKGSRECFSDEQVARFFAILHEALLSRDRLVLCSLLFHSSDNLFKLALKGVQILLPNYLQAIDLVLSESTRLPLHPSASQAEMRAAALRALASVLPWPCVFGTANILDQRTPLGRQQRQPISRQCSTASANNNLLGHSPRYVDLFGHIQKLLVFALRNEPDPSNVHLALALSSLFCMEAAAKYSSNMRKRGSAGKVNGGEEEDGEERSGAISLLRAVLSAICDSLCKPAWANDILCCLAAFDCLNCLSTIPPQILFNNGELSTGSLVITSLCRFIDQQLRRAPPHHSKDMHSTVVAAYFCMNVWLNAAPLLAGIESCLHTVASAIELGMTGGNNLLPEQYKPASQRVHNAAEALLQALFTNARSPAGRRRTTNELELADKFGLQLSQFQHFLVNQSTIVSLHEAQHIPAMSNGLPAVFCLLRTPFHEPWASLVQLVPKVEEKEAIPRGPEVLNGADQTKTAGKSAIPCPTAGTSLSMASLVAVEDEADRPAEAQASNGSGTSVHQQQKQQQKQQPFEIPPEVFQPKCQLDTRFPKLEPLPSIQSQLAQVRTRLAQGCGSPLGEERDARNVWLTTPMGAGLSAQPTPPSPVPHCNSLRVFLHDLGLVQRHSFGSGNEFVALDNSSFEIFYDSLSVTVDQLAVHLDEQVSMFYVREGQRNSREILQNNLNLRQTSAPFCALLSALGKAVAMQQAPIEAIGAVQPGDEQQQKGNINFVLDGLDHCLRWSDAQTRITFVTPTGRNLVEEVAHFTTSQKLAFRTMPSTTASTVRWGAHAYQQSEQQQQIRSKSISKCAINTTASASAYGEMCGGENGLEEELEGQRKRQEDLDRRRALLIWAQSVDEINEMDEQFSNSSTPFRAMHGQADEQPVEEEDDTGITTMRTRIFTIPTVGGGHGKAAAEQIVPLASLSLLTATNVVVKSARFSPRQKLLLKQQSTQQSSVCSSFAAPDNIDHQQQDQKALEKPDELNALSSLRRASEQPRGNRSSRLHLKAMELLPPLQCEVPQQQQQQDPMANTLLLSPPMSPPAVGGFNRDRRKSSIFRDLMGGGGERRKESSEGGGTEANSARGTMALESGRKESLALSDCSQASSTSKGKGGGGGGPAQLQHTNSLTTMSYLKSFFRRTSKAAMLGGGGGAESAAGKMEMGTQMIIGEEVEAEEAVTEVTGTEEQLEQGGKSAHSQQHRESFASSTTGGSMARPSQNTLLESINGAGAEQQQRTSRTMSCTSANESITTTGADQQKFAKRSSDLRIVVVWLERLEDLDHFPLAELLPFTTPCGGKRRDQQEQQPLKSPQLGALPPQVDHICFFLFPFERGLVRVQVDGVWTKYGQPGPLLDGVVVSTQALPALIRQTVSNVARRKTVELENYQMTHSRRKQAIAEFGRRFGSRLSYADFVAQQLNGNGTEGGMAQPTAI